MYTHDVTSKILTNYRDNIIMISFITISYLARNQNVCWSAHHILMLSDSDVFNIIVSCNLRTGLSCLLTISIWTSSGCGAKTDIA